VFTPLSFTPLLIDFYKALRNKQNVENFEIVYCSFDKSFDQYQSYTFKMPWYCIPFDRLDVKTKLVEQFGIRTIPHLVILEPDGQTEIVSGDYALEQVNLDPQGENFPWRPRTLEELIDGVPLQHNQFKQRPLHIPAACLGSKYLMLYFR